MIVVGIDPGLAGGIAVVERTAKDDSIDWQLSKIPIIGTGNNRNELDIKSIAAYVTAIGVGNITLAVIEEPPVVPGNGVLSYRSLFKSYGELRGILTAFDIPFVHPLPQKWKKEILAGTPKDKDAAINYVIHRFGVDLPKLGPKSKKFHDGIADAICLAEYGMRIAGCKQ